MEQDLWDRSDAPRQRQIQADDCDRRPGRRRELTTAASRRWPDKGGAVLARAAGGIAKGCS